MLRKNIEPRDLEKKSNINTLPIAVCGGIDSISANTGEWIVHSREAANAFTLVALHTGSGEIVVVDIEVILQRDPIIPARGIGGIVAKAANARVRAGIVVLQVYFFDGTQINGCIRSKKKWKNIGVNQVIIFSSTLPSAFLKLQIWKPNV